MCVDMQIEGVDLPPSAARAGGSIIVVFRVLSVELQEYAASDEHSNQDADQ